jgi:hypothetical protein
MEVDLPCLLKTIYHGFFLFSFMVISVFYPITYSTGF